MSLKAFAKKIVPPTLWTKLFKLRHEVWGHWRSRHDRARLLAQIGSVRTPRSGPFMRMQYLEEATGSVFFAKLLGTYELEINPAVEWIISYEPDLVIDVGCAEGYYAVGLATRCRSARVIGFDIESRARRLTAKLA
jgi:2-polyprenyl-3-methyl-5-hydroxy-6-metoxy-1,4-benzoquinol methylase